jgi:hypothetical protein
MWATLLQRCPHAHSRIGPVIWRDPWGCTFLTRIL